MKYVIFFVAIGAVLQLCAGALSSSLPTLCFPSPPLPCPSPFLSPIISFKSSLIHFYMKSYLQWGTWRPSRRELRRLVLSSELSPFLVSFPHALSYFPFFLAACVPQTCSNGCPSPHSTATCNAGTGTPSLIPALSPSFSLSSRSSNPLPKSFFPLFLIQFTNINLLFKSFLYSASFWSHPFHFFFQPLSSSLSAHSLSS